MRYISTRGAAPSVGFTATLLSGLAPDGGLYAPEVWPRLEPDEIRQFAGRPYAEVAARIAGLFVGEEISKEALAEDCAAAYARFAHAAVAPLRQLDQGLWLLELFHGPTLAFKDVAMQLLARLYDRVLRACGGRLTIVCATSGDTGGAAVEAFRGSPFIDVVALYPEGRISAVQRRFMTAASEDNVRCLAIGGDFDDCQAIVKAMFADRAFVDAVSLSGVNSINWARILAQSVYYFTSAVALGAPDRAVAFAVPTGNFGDAFAADVARRMGLPIKTIVVATNANDIMARVFETGRYERGRVVETQSPAMDIQVASNFERLYFEILDRDPSATAKAFLEVSEGRGVLIPGKALEGLQSDFTSRAISEGQTSDTMASALQSYDALIDPHTAVALCAASGEGGAGGEIGAPMVVLSTAHPAKFPEAVQAATGRAAPLPAHAHDLFDRKERFDRLPCDLEAVKRYVRAFAARSAP